MRIKGYTDRCRRFHSDTHGNFITIFAVALPVMVLAISAVISFSSAVSYQKELQAAADSAALAATTAMVQGAAASDATTVARNFFAANAPD